MEITNKNTCGKMKKVIIALLLGFCTINLYSQWASNYWGNINGDLNIVNARGMAVTTDRWGRCFVAGYVMSETNGNDIVVIKYNNDGDTVWVRSYNGSGNSEDKAFGIVTDYEGDVYVIGSVTLNGRGLDLVLLKYRKNGNLLWARTYGATSQMLNDEGLAVTLDENGRVCVTGYCTNADGSSDILIQRYSPSGNLLFTTKFDGEDNLDSKGYGIAVNSNNAIYVSGYVTTAENQEDIAVVKLNQNGNIAWTRIYEGGSESSDKAFGIAVDETDNIYVTGFVSEDNSGNSTDAVLLKYNGAGTVKWERSYDGEGNITQDKAWGIVVDEDNNSVFITGQTTTLSSGLDYLTAKYSYSGVRRWVSKYNGTGNGDDYANAISLLNGNKVIVTGASWGTGSNHDYATVKINNSGNNIETNRYSFAGNSDDIAKDIAVSKEDNSTVYVTGYSELIVDGPGNQCAISTVMVKNEGGEKEVNTILPDVFSLHQNYPNPFNPSTTIKFDLPEDVNVRLVIYDVVGKVVEILADQNMEAGNYSLTYTNKNLASGVYFYELRAGDYRDVKKMTLIK
jgi:uncharacterized delta-60 repeat protein